MTTDVSLQWTVNGELRVGFFTKRRILKGEEVTFDYKYERYGQQAQKCLCGSDGCRGWLGGEPADKENVVPASDEDEEEGDEDEDNWSTSSSEDEESLLKPILRVEVQPSTLTAPEPATASLLQPPSTPRMDKRTMTVMMRKKQRKRRSPRKIKNYEDDEVREEKRDCVHVTEVVDCVYSC